MQQNSDGTFIVSPAEKIVVSVTRTKPPCVAIFSKLNGASWDPQSAPTPQTRTRSFTSPVSPGARCDFTLIVDFVGIAPEDFADHYVIIVKGETGTPSLDTVDPTDLPVSLPFEFKVERP